MKEYYFSDRGIILNFSTKFCITEAELLNSESFKKVLTKYVGSLKKRGHYLYTDYLVKISRNTDLLVDLYKMLICFSYDEILNEHFKYELLTSKREYLYNFTEGLYDYWRRLERFAVVESKSRVDGFENASFSDATEEFSSLVLKVYRRIAENILNEKFHVYRQLPAGINATVLLEQVEWAKKAPYDRLKGIGFINSISLRPPFISYTKKNKRDGFFEETNLNPLENIKLTKNNYVCFPVKVGTSLAYVYLHKDYLGHAIALSNLFQMDTRPSFDGVKPDLIYVYGAPRVEGMDNKAIKFYHDQTEDIYVGLAYYGDDIDYFGYLKKMLLTLHNVRMINQGYLPIHGACVNISLKNGKNKTVVIIGDSGAGKSESLEALRTLLSDNINEMKTIFDDMGTFKLKYGKFFAYGTEIGAFVRLDDLENGYAMKEMDRAIFMNPDKTNSRLVMPVSTYNDIIRGYNVDMVLYANNYTNTDREIKEFNTLEECLETFKSGKRFAKGTTTESGIVESYFANPFGPHQRQAQTDRLLDTYFNVLLHQGKVIGEIYTKLGVPGMEQKGPESVARFLSKFIKK